jgi:LmbE family N-acetylglucosaminyl deacetylase
VFRHQPVWQCGAEWLAGAPAAEDAGVRLAGMPPMTFAAFPEDWNRCLAVVAHPDDMEYGSAAAVARWTKQGKVVAYLLASRGEAGIDDIDPERCAELRVQEQIESSAAVGVDVVEFLDYPDGVIEYGLPLRRDIAIAIRRHRPELVIAINHHETFGAAILNMADHRNVGLATVDAVRDAANRWVFTDSGVEPWQGVRYLAIAGSPEAGHAVDITDTFDSGVQSLRCHAEYLRALQGPDPEPFLRQIAEANAERFDDRLATAFELFTLR